MEISQFELIFKPQSPASPSGVIVDRVIQGYFLEITNLEAVEYRYQLEFVAIPPATGAVDRSLAGNTLVFVDVPSADNQSAVLTGSFASSTFGLSTGSIRVPPLATALVAVLPRAFGPPPLSNSEPPPLPNIEVRGFVRIKLPAFFVSNSQQKFSLPFFKAQSNAPVRVLLTPQNRATFIGANGAINGQTQASLPLASGVALNMIPPEPGGPLVLDLSGLEEALPKIAQAVERSPDLASPEMLAVLLGRIDPATADLDAFNAALARVEGQVALTWRDGKKGAG